MANPRSEADTGSDILDIAERLVQTRGFNGFSYADVSSQLGITKAALHYHFPGKAQLGHRLITRYSERFSAALDRIDATDTPAPQKLAAYCDIYRQTLRDHRMCLCGMLAAEYNTLQLPMRQAITDFFDHNLTWLTALLDAGRRNRTLTYVESPDQAAQAIIAALEGAMLVAGPLHNAAVLDTVVDRLIADFAPPKRRRSKPGGAAQPQAHDHWPV